MNKVWVLYGTTTKAEKLRPEFLYEPISLPTYWLKIGIEHYKQYKKKQEPSLIKQLVDALTNLRFAVRNDCAYLKHELNILKTLSRPLLSIDYEKIESDLSLLEITALGSIDILKKSTDKTLTLKTAHKSLTEAQDLIKALSLMLLQLGKQCSELTIWQIKINRTWLSVSEEFINRYSAKFTHRTTDLKTLRTEQKRRATSAQKTINCKLNRHLIYVPISDIEQPIRVDCIKEKDIEYWTTLLVNQVEFALKQDIEFSEAIWLPCFPIEEIQAHLIPRLLEINSKASLKARELFENEIKSFSIEKNQQAILKPLSTRCDSLSTGDQSRCPPIGATLFSVESDSRSSAFSPFHVEDTPSKASLGCGI